jgi:hypothetical protein
MTLETQILFLPRSLKWYALRGLLLFVFALPASAVEWSAEKQQSVTEFMQQYRRDWTAQDTVNLSHGKVPHTTATVFIEGRPLNLRLKADDGRLIPVEVLGQSILVDGKDLSGNLGSKTTHGSNSPIIENVSGSQIATGPGSAAMKDSSASVSVNISLSIALSVSVALNLYLLRQMRRRSQSVAPASVK